MQQKPADVRHLSNSVNDGALLAESEDVQSTRTLINKHIITDHVLGSVVSTCNLAISVLGVLRKKDQHYSSIHPMHSVVSQRLALFGSPQRPQRQLD